MPRVRRCRAAGCHTMCSIDHWYCTKHIGQEAAYLERRAKWARGHDANYQHKYNTQTRSRSIGKREQYAFYKTKRWQELRKLVLNRDQHLDQYAKQAGVYVPGNVVDHIVPIEVDASLMADASNLITCSAATHKLKTAWEQEYYGTGINGRLTGAQPIRRADELPIDFNPPPGLSRQRSAHIPAAPEISSFSKTFGVGGYLKTKEV